MTDWKWSKSSHVWDNIVLIDCEKLKVVIKKAMSEVINMEGMHDEFSGKSFLQSDGGIRLPVHQDSPGRVASNIKREKLQASSIVQLIQINGTHTEL